MCATFYNSNLFFPYQACTICFLFFVNFNIFQKNEKPRVNPFKKKLHITPHSILYSSKQSCTFGYNVGLDVILWVMFGLKINIEFEQLYEKCIIDQHMNTMCKT
jgi:hypothetical protein